MERKMRRFKQLLSEQATKEILNNATNGVLSLIDSDGEPYGVPISYVYDGNTGMLAPMSSSRVCGLSPDASGASVKRSHMTPSARGSLSSASGA